MQGWKQQLPQHQCIERKDPCGDQKEVKWIPSGEDLR